MSAHKHTPGPWKGDPDRCQIIGPDGRSIFAFRRLFPEILANANLAAAAPELLEALKLAVRQNSHDMQLTGEELRRCEAAIAKATGEPANSHGAGVES
jgi:hypothetical protein